MRKLPLLPGLVSQSPVPAPRAQTLTFKNGYALTEQPPVAAALAPVDHAPGATRLTIDLAPPASKLPGWLANDKKVLRFYGFFEEPAPEGFVAPSLVGPAATEPYRVRKLDILLYLVDDTIEVYEPRTPNSGIAQGAFLKRMHVPRKNGGFLGTSDIRVGGDISLFGRTVHVCSCDAFTRKWYGGTAGFAQPLDLPIPESPLDVVRARKTAEARNAAKKGKSEAVRRGVQFLAHDGKVLRFEGRLTEHDSTKEVIVCFYLGDGGIEIKEKGAQMLLHRQKLPVIARSGGVASVGYNPDEEFVGCEHLIVGSSIDVFSRSLQLVDCDPFTRDWYATTLAVEQPEALPPLPSPPSRPVAAVPPHNGYGEPEDTLRNVGVLVPKRGKDDLVQHARFMELFGVALRFTADMEAADPAKPLHPTDEGRKFVVTLFLEDDSIQIYEPAVRDRPGGRFLERTKVRKDGVEGPFFTQKDFYVGARLLLHGRTFYLTGADKYSENFMADNRDMFAKHQS